MSQRLCALTALEVLEVAEDGGFFMIAVLRALSSLRRLQEVSLPVFVFGRIYGNITPNVLPLSTTRGQQFNKYGKNMKTVSSAWAP